MDQVYIVFYDEPYPGYGYRGGDQRVIDGVFDNLEKAQNRVKEIEKKFKFYADYESFGVQ